MASNALNTQGSGPARLEAWLHREGAHEGAGEELDWLVSEARRELTQADDRERMIQLAELLSQWASNEDEEHLACSALMHACQLAEDAGDQDAACDYCEWALRRDPTDRAPMAKLARLLTASGDLARLETARTTQVELLAERAAFEHDLRLEALRALGSLRAEQLHDLDSAIDAYQQAVEIDATDSTIQALAELYLRRDHAGDADDAAELYYQLAERAAPAGARPLLEMALDLRPDHEGALRALQQLSESEESGVDEQRLVSRMVAFASVAPAGEPRDSVIDELKKRNSDTRELEAQLGSSAPAPEPDGAPPPDAVPAAPRAPALSPQPSAHAPRSPVPAPAEPVSSRPRAGSGVKALGETRSDDHQAEAAGTSSVEEAPPALDNAAAESVASPAALAATLAAGGSGSAVTSTIPYSRAVPARPSAGVARAGGAAGPASDQAAPAQSGQTLPFQAMTPTSLPAGRAARGAGSPPIRSFESAPPPKSVPRNWVAWAGGAGLLTLALLALIGIGEQSASTPELAPDSGSFPSRERASAATADSDDEPQAARGEQQQAVRREAARERARREASSDEARAEHERKERSRRAKARREAAPSQGRRSAAPSIGGVSLPPALLRVEGASLDREGLVARLEPVQRKLARCYRALRRHEPRASGLIEYAFRVRPGGRPAKVRSLSGSLDANKVRLCGIRALRAARFPPPQGGAAEVRAVFDFSPPGG